MKIFILLFLIFFYSPAALSDCSKHKNSCIGSGCKTSNEKYKQCVSNEAKNKAKKLAYFHELNAKRLKEREIRVAASSSGTAPSNLQKKAGFEYINIFPVEVAKMEYPLASFDTAVSSLKATVYVSLNEECWNKYKGYVEEKTIRYTTFEDGQTKGMPLKYKFVAKGMSATCRYRKKSTSKKAISEEGKDNDFLSGKNAAPENKNTSNTTAKNNDEFWSGKNDGNESTYKTKISQKKVIAKTPNKKVIAKTTKKENHYIIYCWGPEYHGLGVTKMAYGYPRTSPPLTKNGWKSVYNEAKVKSKLSWCSNMKTFTLEKLQNKIDWLIKNEKKSVTVTRF